MNAIIIDDDALSATVIAQFVDKTGFLRVSGTFSDPAEGLSFIASTSPDLVFLDIEMPGMSGMELINALDKRGPQIILVSSHDEFAIEAFEHKVVDYLVKPVSYPRFFKAAAAARERHVNHSGENHSENDVVFVKKDNHMIRLRKSDITWVEALGDYAILNTRTDRFVMHCTLKNIQEKLPGRSYLRVHRSFIVKIDQIEKVEDNTIFCHNKAIPIGKSYREEVFKRLRLF